MARSISEILRSVRNSRRLTQQQIAEAAGVSPETVRSYASGRRIPDRDALLRLADAMELSMGERRALLSGLGR